MVEISAVTAPFTGAAQKKIDPEAEMRAAADQLEANFLAEMLKSAGLGKPQESFGGGAGEEQFASFLVRAQAEEMVRSGGIGLAERIFEALKERTNAR